ncbi:ATP-binding protein [Actinoplanes sp. NPDC051343]|uniref:ATP-binding protein n=1 Tax=Actinoplanes sp. NPDC051343 TaxID=3363906 RepID=UPI00378DEB39
MVGLLQHIVDDLADLAAAAAADDADADADALTLNRAGHPVAGLLAQVTEAHRGAAVTVSMAVEGEPGAFVDPVRFRQIIGNLLTNAIRHTPASGRVEVRARVRRPRADRRGRRHRRGHRGG